MPVVQRARRRFRPGLAANESRSRAEGGWRLTGQKVWTSRANWAQWGVCLARTDPDAPKHKGITYFLVDMKSEGITIRPLREITGDELFNEVFFDDVFVPDEMVVGNVNDGWRLARTTLANERVAMAHGTALGNPMEQLLETVATAELDPAEQDRLGELIVSAQVGSLLDQRIAQLAVGGQDPGPQASARKLIGVRYRQRLSELRMDLSDGAGIVENEQVSRLPEHPLPDDCRRDRADPAHDGRRATARPAPLIRRRNCLQIAIFQESAISPQSRR